MPTLQLIKKKYLFVVTGAKKLFVKLKLNPLFYTHKFQNFVEAINFVNCLATPAETANHHPDIAISYNKVTINLTTHDVGRLTALDFELATTISQLSR